MRPNIHAKKLILMSILCIMCLFACGKSKKDTRASIKVYYLNENATTLVSKSLKIDGSNQSDIMQEIIKNWQKKDESKKYKSPLNMGSGMLNCYIETNQLYVNMDDAYSKLSATDEILVRAAIVRTFTEIEGIDYVSILVMGEPLTDIYGNPVGIMNAESFVYNDGDEINSNEESDLRLYYADETGTKLVQVVKNVEYNSNNSLEKTVVEQIIKGPNNAETYATVNPDTKIISISVADGICYVNLSNAFLSQTNPVSAEVAIYSIVNSLAELSNINKVHFMIEGNSDIFYQETFYLDTIYERNLDIVID